MAQSEYDDLLAFTLEKVRTLEIILMGVVMADPNPAGLRKGVERYLSSADGTDLHRTVSEEELAVLMRARSDTFAKVFRGVPPPTPADTRAQD